MHSLADIARALNRPTIYLSGLQSRFELPVTHGAGYSDAYLALLRRLVDLRRLGVAEERLLELWDTEKKLLQLLHADSTGSATWFLDSCGMTTHPTRRLLLSQHDVGFVIEGSSLQMGLNFAETPPELFGGQAMGEDALRVLAEYRKKVAVVHDVVRHELPHLRGAASWAARL